MVGAEGFEPSTSWSRRGNINDLRASPYENKRLVCLRFGPYLDPTWTLKAKCVANRAPVGPCLDPGSPRWQSGCSRAHARSRPRFPKT